MQLIDEAFLSSRARNAPLVFFQQRIIQSSSNKFPTTNP